MQYTSTFLSHKKNILLLGLLFMVGFVYAQPNNIQNLPCGTPDAFSLGNGGFVGSNPTTAASSCGQCCYAGSDLDGLLF